VRVDVDDGFVGVGQVLLQAVAEQVDLLEVGTLAVSLVDLGSTFTAVDRQTLELVERLLLGIDFGWSLEEGLVVAGGEIC
jgi:hypothetical protein